jgi:hypothetical protein
VAEKITSARELQLIRNVVFKDSAFITIKILVDLALPRK